jgi:hypothetical protein
MRACAWINTLLLISLSLVSAACQHRAGGVRFLKDLYGYDADQAARLFPASETGEATHGVETRR